MSGIDPSLVYEFVEESREHLTAVEDDFIQLEKSLDAPDPETVNRIFRAVHTVKGSCGFFNFTAIGQLAHTMETLLSLLRDGDLLPTSDMLDALLAGVDLLNSMIDDVDRSNEVDVSKVEGRVAEYISKDDIVVPLNQVGNTKSEINDFEQEMLERIKKGEYLYEIELNLTNWEQESHKSPVQLVSELSKLGEILDGELTVAGGDLRDKIPEGDTLYRLYFKTVIEPDMIDAIPVSSTNTIRLIESEPVEADIITSTAQVIDESVEYNKNLEQAEGSGSDVKSAAGVNESLRVRVDLLNELMMLAGELVLVRNQQLLQQDRADSTSRAITQRLDIVTTELQETIMRTRMQPIGNVFSKFTRVVRDVAKKLDKQISIVTFGDDVELDKNILETLADPLTHIVRNSCDHGIETTAERKKAGKSEKGSIHLNAYHEGGQINIQIYDDGRGINISRLKEKVLEKELKTEAELARLSEKELLELIFLPGLSTVENVSDLSGRGVGMDVVKTSIERLGGIIDIESAEGKGTTLNLRLPLTLAIIPSLIVKVDNERFAIPQVNLEELVCLYDKDVQDKIECVGNREVYRLRDHLLPMVRLSELMAQPQLFDDTIKGEITQRHQKLQEVEWCNCREAQENKKPYYLALNFAVLKVGASRFGLIIDSILGTEEIVVKPMHRAVKDLGIYSGATVLGDGAVALILDVLGLARHATVPFEGTRKKEENEIDAGIANKDEKKSLLLFGNEGEEQFAVEMGEVKRVERLEMNRVERIGQREFATIDGVSTRIIRLEECLQISEPVGREEMFLILPKNAKQPYGILASKLVDIGEFEVDLNTESFCAKGVVGSTILREHMTLLLEPDALAQIAEPEWYFETV